MNKYLIKPVSRGLETAVRQKIDEKTKPLGALGQLETLALQIALCQNTLTPSLNNPTVLIFAGDHGVAASGVSLYPSSVTAQMVANFLSGGAAISVFARQHGLALRVVDAGVNADLEPHPQLVNANIAKGTKNFLFEPAMSESECELAIEKGAAIVREQAALGCNCIGFGEMGIGNTSSAALMMHVLTELPLSQCVGRGTGLNDEQLARKMAVLQQAIQRNDALRASAHPTTVLQYLGGFEIAMMVGAFLQAAECGMVILVDGFICSSALLVASRLYPNVLDYCVFSHQSNEQGHLALLKEFNARPLLALDLRLGEGSGAALAFPLLQSAVLFLNEMASFTEAGVDVECHALHDSHAKRDTP